MVMRPLQLMNRTDTCPRVASVRGFWGRENETNDHQTVSGSAVPWRVVRLVCGQRGEGEEEGPWEQGTLRHYRSSS